MAGEVGHSDALPRLVPVTWWSKWIGRPFGAERFNCWTLVCEVYADQLGITLPPYGEISARDLSRVAREMGRGKDDGWLPVERPREFDVALMRSGRGGRLVVHVGVMIDGLRMLHVEEATAAVVVPVAHFSVAGRIMGYRRHVSCDLS